MQQATCWRQRGLIGGPFRWWCTAVNSTGLSLCQAEPGVNIRLVPENNSQC